MRARINQMVWFGHTISIIDPPGNTVAYDPATGRLASMLANRRVSCAKSGTAMGESRTDTYGYNARSELISAAKTGGSPSPATEHEYAYDPIGNRQSSADLGESRTYTANNLNQYTGISDGVDTFAPQFDDDGDQTLIQTKTGVWSVTYNGDNRPVSWSCGETNIVMSFDRMGRRVSYTETVGAVTNAHRTFVYDNYLQIANSELLTSNSQLFVWDPTEPVATRPLVWLHGGSTYYYTHDGNKNVSEVVDANGVVAAHYEYAPFGEVTAAVGNLASANRFRFSSEYSDDTLGLVYYNYRHYDPVTGRWMGRDPILMYNRPYLYVYVDNFPVTALDRLGLLSIEIGERIHTNDPMELRLPFKAADIKEGCELNFIQITKDLERNVFVVDSKSSLGTMGDTSHPVEPYYYNREEIDRMDGFVRTDGTVIFVDRPNAETQFYLFPVQRCCLKYYDNQYTCKCCQHSKATVLRRVAWTTKTDGKAVIQTITPYVKKRMDNWLKTLVDGKTSHVPCSKYMGDNPEQMSMPTLVDVDFGDDK